MLQSEQRRLVLYMAWLAFACSGMAIAEEPATNVEIIAHRGASHDAPENTLSSVRLAWRRGAPSVEVDVFLSRDNQVIVYHDKTTKRIGGRDRPVTDQTLEELHQLDVGSWKHDKYADERIPTLGQVLKTVPRGGRIYIEIKDNPRIVPYVTSLLKTWKHTADRAVVIAFSYDVVLAMKKAMPDLPIYWLISFKRGDESQPWKPDPDSVIQKTLDANVAGISINMSDLITPDLVQRVHDRGLGFYVWTVDDPADGQRLLDAGVDGITTNRPRWFAQQLGLSND
jgi:glycerophosphoryl diester phosphodiesterase